MVDGNDRWDICWTGGVFGQCVGCLVDRKSIWWVNGVTGGYEGYFLLRWVPDGLEWYLVGLWG